MAASVSFQVRVEPDLMREVKNEASRRHVSVNRVLTDAISSYLKAEKEREWREGFEAMGRDSDSCDAEYLLPAAREVILGE
jgi:post-segregation antitoxin (ccd killing protein)